MFRAPFHFMYIANFYHLLKICGSLIISNDAFFTDLCQVFASFGVRTSGFWLSWYSHWYTYFYISFCELDLMRKFLWYIGYLIHFLIRMVFILPLFEMACRSKTHRWLRNTPSCPAWSLMIPQHQFFRSGKGQDHTVALPLQMLWAWFNFISTRVSQSSSNYPFFILLLQVRS